MPIPGEQPDLNALPPESSPVSRRLATQHLREARDRLTSSSETKPAFEYELLRQYAQNRISASLVILLLVATVGFMSSIWSGALAAGAWTVAVLAIHAIIVAKCQQFLEKPTSEVSIRAWRLRFITLDLFYGLAWMFILIHPVGVDDNSGTFMLFVMLLVVAVSSMLASSLPTAAFAATFPVTTAIALDFVLQGRLRDYILSIMSSARRTRMSISARSTLRTESGNARFSATVMQHRAGGEHLGVDQRVPRQQTVEIPAVAVGPFHHRRNAKAPIEDLFRFLLFASHLGFSCLQPISYRFRLILPYFATHRNLRVWLGVGYD